MTVSVNFIGQQRVLAKTDSIQVPINGRSSVADVLDHLKTAFPKLTFPENAMLVTVNDQAATMDHILGKDDKISFLPFIGGG